MANDTLYSVKFSEIWAYFKSQDILFWLINIYLFMEYVRPQALYSALDGIPFTQIILVFTLVILITKKIKLPGNIVNLNIIIFSLIILVSSVFAISPSMSFQKINDYFAWVIIYFLIISIINTRKRFFIFILCFLVYSFKMSQFSFRGWALNGFSFSDWGTGGGPGWFHNSGEFGIQMCVFLPISFYFFFSLKEYWPRWKKIIFLLFPLTALSGTISCSSRGALVGSGAVIFWILLKSKRKLKGLLAVGVIAVLVWAVIPQEQKSRFKTAGEDKTSLQRVERWEKGQQMAKKYPVLGVGYANWSVADGEMFGGGGGLAHNIFIQCMSELGYTGLLVFGLLILSTLLNNYQTRKLIDDQDGDGRFFYYMTHGLDGALVGFLVSGYFVTVLYYPYFWINLSMTVALNNIVRCEHSRSAGQSSISPVPV